MKHLTKCFKCFHPIILHDNSQLQDSYHRPFISTRYEDRELNPNSLFAENNKISVSTLWERYTNDAVWVRRGTAFLLDTPRNGNGTFRFTASNVTGNAITDDKFNDDIERLNRLLPIPGDGVTLK